MTAGAPPLYSDRIISWIRLYLPVIVGACRWWLDGHFAVRAVAGMIRSVCLAHPCVCYADPGSDAELQQESEFSASIYKFMR